MEVLLDYGEDVSQVRHEGFPVGFLIQRDISSELVYVELLEGRAQLLKVHKVRASLNLECFLHLLQLSRVLLLAPCNINFILLFGYSLPVHIAKRS